MQSWACRGSGRRSRGWSGTHRRERSCGSEFRTEAAGSCGGRCERFAALRRRRWHRTVVGRLLKEFADVFPAELPAGLPPRRAGLEHRIKLKPHYKAPYRRPYKCGPAELKLLQETIRDMEQKGFIQRSQSRYGAPVLFI